MTLSKENSSGSPQLNGLLDLLIDLQIINSSQDSSEESPPNENTPSQDEALGSQSVEECQDSPTNADTPELANAVLTPTLPPVLELESKGKGETNTAGEIENFSTQPQDYQQTFALPPQLPQTELPPATLKSRYSYSFGEGFANKEGFGDANTPQYCSDKTDLTPPTPLPFKGRGEQYSPLLVGEGQGERLTEDNWNTPSGSSTSKSDDLATDDSPTPLKSEERGEQYSPLLVGEGQGERLTEDNWNTPSGSSTSKADDLATDDSLKAVEDLPNQLSQSQQQQEQQQESKNPPVLSKVERNQPENLDNLGEQQVLNQLIQSHWQKAQRNGYGQQSIGATGDKEVDNSLALFERWQRLLLTQELMDARAAIAKFKEKLESLEHQIYEPTELTKLLLPLFTEILSLKVAESRKDVAQAIAPLADEIIQVKAQQDKESLSRALAPVLPDAVAQQVSNSPGEFAKALGPEIGPAIKEQISLERDAMVDALYPVIGSTISKYMAEVIKSINDKVENTLSLEGISRKIRAKMQGVSEAELILKEAMPFTVQAVFLIHKASGLVIAEMQPIDKQHLESEMVAGMLTAIRSFVNDCIAQSGDVSEIDQIEYGNSKIILEVAGYCYLAVVTQGQPPKSFIQNMRGTVSTIIQRNSKPIELFDGDPANVPEEVHQNLQTLTELSNASTEVQKRQAPVGLILVGLGVLSAIFIPLGISHHLRAIDRGREEQISLALASDPELSVYHLMVEANHGALKLCGKLPNQYLRLKAEQIARKVEPKLKLYNAIIPVVVPADPVLAEAEVKRVTSILNQMEGAVITADYSGGKVTVQGTVLQEADAQKVTQAFQQIPGVQSVTNTVQLQTLAIASRVYFDRGSSELKSEELSKITQIREFLKQYPNKYLRLLGHTDPMGTDVENEPLAVERATKVRGALVNQGVDPNRLKVVGTTTPPIGVKAEQVPLLSRCVEFEIITP